MKLNDQNDVETTLEEDGQDFSIDMESMSVLFKGFSDNLYSNKIGSIVREITSNCFDAHQELGVQRDVEIDITDPDMFSGSTGRISFRDFGIGLSPDRIKNIYSKYFSSTKRDSNDEIGGFGIGAKSPLSYTEFFEVNTVVDGILYNYLVHRGEKVPRIELLEQSETDLERGTEVVIPIKSSADCLRFKLEMRSQLKYFDSIRYINCDIPNDYKIYRGEHFILRNTALEGNMGVCIGKVAYPLDYSQLEFDISKYSFNNTKLSLRFDIGDLSVTMNREAIEYTDGTSEKIREKLDAATKELEQLKIGMLKDEEDIGTYMKMACNYSFLVLDGELFRLPYGIHSEFSNTIWNFKPLRELTLFKPAKHYMGNLFRIRGLVVNGVMSKKSTHTGKFVEDLIKGEIPVYRIKGPATGKKLAYISEKFDRQFYLVSMREDIYSQYKFIDDQGGYATSIRDGESYDRELFGKELKKYVNFIGKYLVEHSESYDKVVIDPEWEKEYNESRVSLKTSSDEITIRRYLRSAGYVKLKFKIRQIYGWNRGTLKIYAFQGEEHLLSDKFRMGLSNPFDNYFNEKLRVFKISRDNARKLRELENFYHVSEIPEEIEMRLFGRGSALRQASKDLEYIEDIIDKPEFRNLLRGTVKNISIKIERVLNITSFPEEWTKLWANSYVCLEREDGVLDIWDIENRVFLGDLMAKLRIYLDDNPLLKELLVAARVLPHRSQGRKLIAKTIKLNIKPFIYK